MVFWDIDRGGKGREKKRGRWGRRKRGERGREREGKRAHSWDLITSYTALQWQRTEATGYHRPGIRMTKAHRVCGLSNCVCESTRSNQEQTTHSHTDIHTYSVYIFRYVKVLMWKWTKGSQCLPGRLYTVAEDMAVPLITPTQAINTAAARHTTE